MVIYFGVPGRVHIYRFLYFCQKMHPKTLVENINRDSRLELPEAEGCLLLQLHIVKVISELKRVTTQFPHQSLTEGLWPR